MGETHTTATLYRDDQVLDISIPVRSTVAGVLAQIGTATDPLVAYDELGRKVAANETFGGSIPAGSTLYLRSKLESEAEAQRKAKAAKRAERRAAAAPIAAIGILVLLSPIVALMMPTAWPIRIALGFMLAIASVSLLWRIREQPLWHGLLSPPVAAAAASVLVPHPALIAGWSYGLVFFWAGTLMAMLVPTLHRHEHYESMQRLWLIPAAGLSLISVAQTVDAVAAPMGLAAAVVLLGLAPTASIQVPDGQLLDLPAVMSTAPSVHDPKLKPPARITAPRVRHTLRLAHGLHTVSITTACIVLVATAPAVLTRIGESTIEGGASLALVALAFGHFLLQPRNSRTAFARWTPRIVVVAMLCLLLMLRPGGNDVLWLTLTTIAAALVCAVGLWIRRGMYAPLITRMADVFEQVALTLAVPAAIVASGAFSAVRAMA